MHASGDAVLRLHRYLLQVGLVQLRLSSVGHAMPMFVYGYSACQAGEKAATLEILSYNVHEEDKYSLTNKPSELLQPKCPPKQHEPICVYRSPIAATKLAWQPGRRQAAGLAFVTTYVGDICRSIQLCAGALHSKHDRLRTILVKGSWPCSR